MSKVKLYKTIDFNEENSIQIYSKREYFYIKNDTRYVIQENQIHDSVEKLYSLEDESYEWDFEKESAFLNLTLLLDNIESLFGKNGVAYDDTIIGVGLEWKPKNSKLKKCIKLGEISLGENQYEFNVKSIELKSISSDVDFKILFYIIKPGTRKENLSFGNIRGLILGEQILWSLKFNGNGSVFPIQEIKAIGDPLWKIKCDFEDVYEDDFSSDNVAILINSAHPSYKLFNEKSEYYSKEFLVEVISSALVFLILEIKNMANIDAFDFESGGSLGSIILAMKYFNDVLKFKVNGTNNQLLASIKSFFDKEY